MCPPLLRATKGEATNRLARLAIPTPRYAVIVET